MAYTNVWSDTVPTGAEAANTIGALIKSVRVDMQDRLADIFAIPTFTADPLRPFGLKFGDTQDATINFGDNAGTPWAVLFKDKTSTNSYFGIHSFGVVVTPATLTGISTPFYNVQQTWNNAATVFVGELVNVTNTASDVGSLFYSYFVNGVLSQTYSLGGVLYVAGPTAQLVINSTSNSPLVQFSFAGAPSAFISAVGTDDITILDHALGNTATLNVANAIFTNASVSGTFTANVVGNITGNAATATKLATARSLSITGDLTWTSPVFDGSADVTAAGTLATVNGNVGAFGSATQSVGLTINAKGLITSASVTNIIAPASTLSGTTLNGTVVTSSLTSVGALTSGSIGAGFGAINIAQQPITTGELIVFDGTNTVSFLPKKIVTLSPGSSVNLVTGLSVNNIGSLILAVDHNVSVAIFSFIVGFSTLLVESPVGTFSNAIGTASKINVGISGGNLVLENKSISTINCMAQLTFTN